MGQLNQSADPSAIPVLTSVCPQPVSSTHLQSLHLLAPCLQRRLVGDGGGYDKRVIWRLSTQRAERWPQQSIHTPPTLQLP